MCGTIKPSAVGRKREGQTDRANPDLGPSANREETHEEAKDLVTDWRESRGGQRQERHRLLAGVLGPGRGGQGEREGSLPLEILS